MDELLRKVKNLKREKYNEFTGGKLLEQLRNLTAFDARLFEVINVLEKEEIIEETFVYDAGNLKTKEAFIYTFVKELMTKEGAELTGLATLLHESKTSLSFAKLCAGILILSRQNYKTHEQSFAVVAKQLLFLADTFYRLVFEMFYHESKELGEAQQAILLKTGYLKVSGAVIHFIKDNKKCLELSLNQHHVLTVNDFLNFDGENLERFHTIPRTAINHAEFLKFVGHLTARMDFIRFFVDKDDSKDLHEILQFKDIRASLKNFEEKLAHDAMAVIESEAGYFEYKKYRLLSLRRDKIFNLHKNIVTNTDQPDEHLDPTKDEWEGYGGFYPIYLVRQYLVKDRAFSAFLSPSKLARLVLHVLCCVPENSYTGGEYYMRVLQFVQDRLTQCGFEELKNLNEGNLFWYDTFVALKRIDFNIKPKTRPLVVSFFKFLMSKISSKQTRYLICTKLLDMDYIETFFQTASISTSVLEVIHQEVAEAKFNAFDNAELFLRKDLIEKVHGHIIKGDHKQLGYLRMGSRS